MALIGRGFRNVRMALSPRPAGLSSWPASRAGAPSLPRGVSSPPRRPLPSLPRRRGRAPLCPGGRPTPPPRPADPLLDLALSPPGVHPFPGGWLSSGSLPGSPTSYPTTSPVSVLAAWVGFIPHYLLPLPLLSSDLCAGRPCLHPPRPVVRPVGLRGALVDLQTCEDRPGGRPRDSFHAWWTRCVSLSSAAAGVKAVLDE